MFLRGKWLLAAIFALVLGGCTEQQYNMMADGFEKSAEEQSKKIESVSDRIGAALERSADDSAKKMQSFADILTQKYRGGDGTDIFAPTPAQKKAAAAEQAQVKKVYVPQKIEASILGDRVLQHRGLRQLWKLTLDGTGVCHTYLDDNYLYVLTNGNIIYSIELRSGLTVWKYDIGRKPDSLPGFGADYVVVSAGEVIRVLDKRIGKELWRFETDIQPATRPFCGKSIFVYGTWTGHIAGFGYGDVHPRWKYYAGSPVFSTPFVVAPHAYTAGDNGSFYRFNVLTGAKKACEPLRARPVSDIIGNARMLFLATDNFELFGVNTETGDMLWKHSADGRFLGGPWVSKDEKTLYYSADEDALYALNMITGEKIWKLSGGIKVVGTTDREMFVLCKDGSIAQVNAESGAEIWKENIAPFTAVVSQSTSPIICLISEDGQLFAIGPKK